MKYSDDYDVDFDIPRSIKREIEKDYIQKTFYWFVGLSCFTIGILIGTAI